MFATLHNIVLQLYVNTISVPFMLGCFAYGLIGILISPITYTTLVSMSAFIVPAPPGPLNVTNNTM